MTKRFWIVLLAAGMLLGVAQAAQAGLAAVGPTSPATGYFPVYYQDATGRQLELCLSQAVGPNGPMCVLLAAPGFDPALPVVFPVNFPDESFWFIADALIDPGTGLTLTYRAAVEAAFANGAVTNGDQISFARIRVRMNVTVPSAGNYTITHPYGTENFVVTGDVGRVISLTRDVGVGAPGNFGGALGGDIGPFLVRADVSGQPSLIPIVTGGVTETFIGDPNVTQAVTGGPNGNIVRIQGPSLDLQTNQFFLAGKVWGGVLPTNVSVERASYSRSAAGSQIDVFATSTPTATLSFSDTVVPTTPMTPDGNGKFYGRAANPAAIPSYVVVTATNTTTPTTRLASRVVDVVKITKALYALTTKTLLVEAASSDQVAPPTLTAVGFGPLTVVGSGPTQQFVVVPLAEPPARVTVKSSQGGADTEPVVIVSSFNVAPVAVNDTTSTNQGTPVNIAVLANDTDPDGNLPLTVASLTTPSNGTATLSNNVVTYTPNALFTGTDTFTYQAQDSAGALSNVATVTVNVVAVVNLAPIAQNDSATTTAGQSVAINLVGNDSDPDGTININSVAIVSGSGPTGGTLQLNVPSAGRVTYTPNTGFAGTDTFRYTVADNLGLRSNEATVTVQVNPANQAPIAGNDTATTVANTAVSVNVLANDTDPDNNLPLTVGSVGVAIAPTRGTAVNNFNGTVTYQPNTCNPAVQFTGYSDEKFSYVAVDALGARSAPATVSVTVNPRPETLTATASARVRGGTAEWTINGTTTVFPGNTITVRLLRTNALIGTAVPDNQGRWKLSVKNSTVVPVTSDQIRVNSSFCNLSTFPVTVR